MLLKEHRSLIDKGWIKNKSNFEAGAFMLMMAKPHYKIKL